VRLTSVNSETLNKCIRDESAVRTSADCLYWFSQGLIFKLEPECVADLPPLFTEPRRTANPTTVATTPHAPSIESTPLEISPDDCTDAAIPDDFTYEFPDDYNACSEREVLSDEETIRWRQA